MNIVHIIPSIELQASGPTYSVTRLCESLISRSLPILLVALGVASRLIRTMPWLIVFPRTVYLYKLGVSFKMLRWLIRGSQSSTISLLHSHGLWMMPNIYPGYIAHRFKIPLIISPRGTLSLYAMRSGTRLKILFWHLFQKKVLRQASCFHATSFAEYLDIRRLGFHQPVALIPNGIDIKEMIPSKTEGKFRTLLFLGRIHPIKGLDILLPAWKELQSIFPAWQLRIVGPDNNGYLDQMKSLADELNLERVEFTGPVYGRDKNVEINAADLFVLSSYSENFGVAVAEALSAGLPVVVSRGTPWEGVIKNNAGWWIDIGVKPLVSALYDAMNKPSAELKKMGINGRHWMRNEYSWDAVANKMALTYQWMLNNGEAPDWVILD